jgi:HEAT repeat protein
LALINKKDKLMKTAAAEAINREGIGPNYGLLLSKGLVQRLGLGSLIYDTVTGNDRDTIRAHLSHIKLDYGARELVLALCKVGRAEDLDFLFDLFGEYKDEIRFQNHVRVVTCMAKMCTKRKAVELKKFINSKEFWSYVCQGERRPRNRLPIKNTDNQAFIRRLIAACFIEKATRADIKLIMKLLDHNYSWIARRAAVKLSEIGKTEDIDKLVNLLWKLDEKKLEDADPAIYGLSLLDDRLRSRAA